jgi:hypothetical protein
MGREAEMDDPGMDEFDMEEFFDIEKYLESCGSTTIRKSIGGPDFLPLAKVPPGELHREVDRILELLFENSIEVDLRGCEPAEAYRFLTTELMEESIEHPRAPGWTACFIYAFYHPDSQGKDTD